MVRDAAEGVMDETLAEPSPYAKPVQADLVGRARAGERDAFDQLMSERIDATFRTAMAILGHEADARDATQESFVKAWRELPRLRDVQRFDAWLGRILVNTCRSALRSRYRSRAREIPVAALPMEPDNARTSRSTGLEDHAADLDLLERAFDRLAADDRALLVLHHLDRQPVSVIALTFGIPEGTAKSRLYAARRTLARALEVEHHD